MTDSRLPKQLLRGELCQGKHSVGGQKKRFKDCRRAWLRHDRLLLTLAGASLRTQTYFRLSLLSAAYFRRRDIKPKAENPSAFAGLAGAGLASLAGALWPVTQSLGQKDCVTSQKERLQGSIEGEMKKGQGLTASARYFKILMQVKKRKTIDTAGKYVKISKEAKFRTADIITLIQELNFIFLGFEYETGETLQSPSNHIQKFQT